jgi:isoquinoline 1-oxidoreductase beta subunit
MVNPDTVRAQIEGGVMFGLSAALFNEITFANGRVQQSNFNDFRSLRINEAPNVDTYLIPSEESLGGVGEASTSCAAAALCNAIYAASGPTVAKVRAALERLKRVGILSGTGGDYLIEDPLLVDYLFANGPDRLL